ncbi:hypothetical protein BC827DRAFT_1268296 [Russula dissimulans]|nr:hypothetical protein BC827DRAFT_1268296 [Russula dissimulans]
MPFSNRPFPSSGAQSLARGNVAMNKANLADQPSHVDDDGIEWTESVSKNGVPFQVGVKRTEVKGDREDFKRPGGQTLNSIKYNVDWPVGHDDTWIETSGELHANYISKYSLHKATFTYFDYKLEIYSVRKGVKYTFIDESGDYYTITVNVIGQHYVQYDSKEPKIKRVQVEFV